MMSNTGQSAEHARSYGKILSTFHSVHAFSGPKRGKLKI